MINICSSQMNWVNEQNTLIKNSVEYLTKLISYKLPENLIKQFEEKSKKWTVKYQEIMVLLMPINKHINTFSEEPKDFDLNIIQTKNLETELQFLIEEKIKPLNHSIGELMIKISKQDPTAQVNTTQVEESRIDYLSPIQFEVAVEKLSYKCKELITQKPSSNKSEALTAGHPDSDPYPKKMMTRVLHVIPRFKKQGKLA